MSQDVDLAKFPSLCPNPVLRVDRNGVLEYANREGACLAERWDVKVGSRLPSPWPALAEKSLEKNSTLKVKIRLSDDVFVFAVVPIIEARAVYLFGLDVTTKEAFKSLRDDMLFTVSRELAAPLSLVQSALGNLKDGSSVNSPFVYAKMMNIIERNVKRMSLLLSDMTDLLNRDPEEEWDDSALDRLLNDRAPSHRL